MLITTTYTCAECGFLQRNETPDGEYPSKPDGWEVDWQKAPRYGKGYTFRVVHRCPDHARERSAKSTPVVAQAKLLTMF